MKKRVISFSLWGQNEGYCHGALANIDCAHRYYPGWVCRFYLDETVPKHITDAIIQSGSEVVFKPEGNEFLRLFWRFEPMYDDATIERFIVRDTDSRVNAREADAVQEWIESGTLFHIMRDHDEHNIEIVGGMWGSVAGIIPHWKKEADAFVEECKPDAKNPKGLYHNADQVFLCRHIWPIVKDCHTAHDDQHVFTGRERKYRVKLKDRGYVGMVYSEQDHHRTLAEGENV